MTALNYADRLYIGGAQASAAYVGATKVWPWFKPTDLGTDLVGWFDGADAASVVMAGSKVSQWTNKGVGAMTFAQATDAYRPTYASNAVSFASGQVMAVANAPASYDLVMVSKPRGSSDWRTLLRNTSHPTVNAHHVIIESGNQCLGIYNGGMFQAGLTRVSPINMTANNVPAPYIASASTEYSAVYAPFKAFDGDSATFAHSLNPTTTEPWTIRMNLGAFHTVSRYSYTARADGAQQWKDWILYGTKDNWATWDAIDTVNSEPIFAGLERRTYGIDNPGSYHQYQWNISAGQNYTPPYAAAVLLELFTGLTWGNTQGLMYGRFADGAAPSMSRDGGALVSTGTVLASGGAVFQVFGGYQGPPPSQPWGDISEIIFVTHNTSDANRQKLEGYLAWKWSLTALLPVTHPYKTVRP